MFEASDLVGVALEQGFNRLLVGGTSDLYACIFMIGADQRVALSSWALDLHAWGSGSLAGKE